MESVEAKIERLKAALKAIENVGGAGQLVLKTTRNLQNIKRAKWEPQTEWWKVGSVIFTAYVGKAYANHRIARALMLAAGLDPDGNDGVKLEAE